MNSNQKALSCLLTCLLVVPGWLFSQSFVRSYGLPNFLEVGTCMVPDGNTSLYVGGYRADSVILLEVDPEGALLRKKTFKVLSNQFVEKPVKLMLDARGGIIGAVMGYGSGSLRGGYVFRYDFAQNSLDWVLELPTSYYPQDLLEPVNNLITVVGGTQAGVLGNDGLVFQVNELTGGIVGQPQVYNLGSAEIFRGAVRNGSETLVTGRWNHQGGGTSEMRASVARLDSALQVIDGRSFYVSTSSSARIYSNDIAALPNNKFVICAGGAPSGSAPADAIGYLSVHDPTLGMAWGRGYSFQGPGSSMDFLNVCPDGDNFAVLGEMGVDKSAVILYTDSLGTPVWCFGFSDHLKMEHYGNGKMIVWNDHLYVTGTSATGNDLVLLRVGRDGVLDSCNSTRLTPVFNTMAADYPANLTGNPSNFGINQPFPATTFDPPLEIYQPCDMVVANDPLQELPVLTVHPNPNHGQFYCAFNLPTPGKLSLHHIDGRLLRQISLETASGQLELDASDLSAGMYFISAESEGEVVKTVKFVKY